MNSEKIDQSKDIEYLISLGAQIDTTAEQKLEIKFYHSNLSDNDFIKLSKLENIESLIFYLSNINNTTIKQLKEIPGLKKLGIYSCKNVNDASISDIVELSLQELALIDTSISNSGKLKLKQLSPHTIFHMKLEDN